MMNSMKRLEIWAGPRRLVKICGITSLEDALACIEYGANALGFNFFSRSPRFISPDTAEEIIRRLPAEILSIGVVVWTPSGRPPNGLPSSGFLDCVQLHGVDFPLQLPPSDLPLMVAVSPEKANAFPDHDIIIDTSWGRGERADWDALKKLERPYILSGGLGPDNVEEAIRILDPAGLDVCSGVEESPGVKDHRKLKEFLRRAVH